MSAQWRAVAALALPLALLAPACGSRNPVQGGDGSGPGLDGPGWTDVRPTDGWPLPLDLGVRGRDFVVSKVSLPGPSTIATIGVDYDGDGHVDNALGSILGAFAGISSHLNMQSTVDGAVNSGATLLLLRLQARDYVNAKTAAAWTWVAQSTSCCSDPNAVYTCKQEALKGCFAGGHVFVANKASASQLGGSITGGALRFGPGPLRFRFALPSIGVIDLTLKQARILGPHDGKGIRDAILAGGVDKQELNSKLLPALAAMLTAVLKDPTVDKPAKDTLQTLFDVNKDQVISTAEVKDNPLIKTFLAGDVDVDHDGVKELSLGLRFDAVSAIIKD